MNTKDAIRLTLIDLMDEKNVSGKELAEAVGVSKQAVSSWRTGKGSIDINNVPAICEFFGITFDEFFGNVDTEQSASGLTPDEQQLIELYRSTTEFGQHSIMTLAAQLAEAAPRPKPGDFPHLFLSDEMSDEEVDERVAAYEAALEEWTKTRREGSSE